MNKVELIETIKYICRDGTNVTIQANVEDCSLYIEDEYWVESYGEENRNCMTVYLEDYGLYIRAYARIRPNKQKICINLVNSEFTQKHLDKLHKLSSWQKCEILKKIIDPLWEGVDFTGGNSEDIEDEALDEIRKIILKEVENIKVPIYPMIEQNRLYEISNLLWIDATITLLEDFFEATNQDQNDCIKLTNDESIETYYKNLYLRFKNILKIVPELDDLCPMLQLKSIMHWSADAVLFKRKVKCVINKLIGLQNQIKPFSDKTIKLMCDAKGNKRFNIIEDEEKHD